MSSLVAISGIQLLRNFMELSECERPRHHLDGGDPFHLRAVLPAPGPDRPAFADQARLIVSGRAQGRDQHPPAGLRQCRQREGRLRLRIGVEPRVQDGLAEPPGQRGVAAVAGRHRVLALAGRLAGRAFDADMEMVVVPVHRAHLGQPAAVACRLAADRLLDGRIDEDALDLRLLAPRPGSAPGGPASIWSGRRRARPAAPRWWPTSSRALRGDSVRSGIGRQPDVGVEPDLMRRVAGQHRAAARLRDVADEHARPAVDGRHLFGETLEEGDQRRVAPVAVARQPHHLPGRAVDRQRLGAGEAAVRVEADRARLQVGRRRWRGRTAAWPAGSGWRDWRAAAAASGRACRYPAPARARGRSQRSATSRSERSDGRMANREWSESAAVHRADQTAASPAVAAARWRNASTTSS